MSQSSDDEIESNIWIPYSQRKEWSDVKPLQQNEGPDPVAKIAYSDKCKFIIYVEGSLQWTLIISYSFLLVIHV